MRTILLAFIGASCGIALGMYVASPFGTHVNTTPAYQTFAQPAIDSSGRVVEVGGDYVIVSFANNLVEFQVTPGSKLLEFQHVDARTKSKQQRQSLTPVPSSNMQGKNVIVIHELRDSLLVADEIWTIKVQ